MSASMTQLLSCSVFARDGRAGSLSDVLFDDRTWRVKWLVAETGPWLFGHEVLIRPDSLLDADEADGHLRVDLTRAQIEHSPDIRTDPPHHLQKEGIMTYGEVMPYEPGHYGIAYKPPKMPAPFPCARPSLAGRSSDPHLRSAAEMLGYEIDAPDGRLGFLKDLRLSPSLSCVEKGVVQPGRWWWPRQEVLIDPHVIGTIEWPQQRLALSRSRHAASTGAASLQGGSVLTGPWSSGVGRGLVPSDVTVCAPNA